MGTSAGSGIAFSLLKYISAAKASKRWNHQALSAGGQRETNVAEVVVDLSFPDSDLFGEFPCSHLSLTQKQNHLLTYGLSPFLDLFLHIS